MLKRFFALLKALFADETKMLDDPERLLDDAQTKMREAQALNRKRAVEAVTAKNNFQQLCADTRNRIERLTAKISEAERRGEKEEAQKLQRECEKYEETLLAMEAQLARAIEMSEQVKDAIRREEEKIRQKTRDALELKARWKDSQIPSPIDIRSVTAFYTATLLFLVLVIVLVLIAGCCSHYLSTSAL